ncbi:YceI family protein [Calidifontibacter terrae]
MSDLQQLNGTYVLDGTHSRIGFVARHAMVTKVRGSFDEFEGKATTGENLAGASIELTAQVASVNTRNADRDGHLRTSDFFEAEKYPTITFRSTQVSASGNGLKVVGDLTIKDVTKSIEIDFDFEGSAQDPYGNTRIGFEGKSVISRSDWGLTYNAALETGGVLISDKITLEFEVSAIKQA